MINAADVHCPKCGGPVWDERPNKKNPKGPDFRCKDKTCLDDKGYKTSIWERDLLKNAPRAAAPSNAKQEFSAGGPLPWEREGPDAEHPPMKHEKLDSLLAVYTTCYKHAAHLAKEQFGNDASDTAVASMAATTFIAAKDRGLAA